MAMTAEGKKNLTKGLSNAAGFGIDTSISARDEARYVNDDGDVNKARLAVNTIGSSVLTGTTNGLMYGGWVGAIIGGIIGLGKGVFRTIKKSKKLEKRQANKESARRKQAEEFSKSKQLREDAQESKVMNNNLIYKPANIPQATQATSIPTPKSYAKGGSLTYNKKKPKPIPDSKLKISYKFYDGGGLGDPKKKKGNNLRDKKNKPKALAGGKYVWDNKLKTWKLKTQTFRRGGELDLKKKNIIADGPSHDEENETGVEGDKGLPIVKNSLKIAEIESRELILNSEAVAKLNKLIADYKKSGDDSLKIEIGKLLDSELGENTYDYSDLLD